MRVEQTQAKVSNPPQQIAYIVYIAGVHVPVNNVSVTSSVGSFPVLNFSMPATADLIKLGEEDRTPVAVFFLDKWYSPQNPKLGIKPTWRLLFDGDIVGWGFSKGVNSKTISFSAVSHIAALNSMSIMYITGKGNELMSNVSSSSVESLNRAVLKDMRSLSFYKKGLYGTGDITRPIDFVKNLLLGIKIGGAPKDSASIKEGDKSLLTQLKEIDTKLKNVSSNSVSGSDFKDLRIAEKVPAAMEFFIKYSHRNRLDKRWITSSIDVLGLAASGSQNTDSKDEEEFTQGDTEGTKKKKKVSKTLFTSVIQRITRDALESKFKSTTAPTADFWSMITNFYQNTWYNLIIIPTAQYVSVEEDEDIPLDAVPSADSARLANCISVPQMTYALPPACNVITPAMTISYNYEERYSSQNTRTIANGYAAFGTVGAKLSKQKMLEFNALRFGYPTDQNQLMEKANSLKKSAENILVYPEEYFKGPVVTRPQAPSYYVTLEHSSKYTHNQVNKEAAVISSDYVNNDKTQQLKKDEHTVQGIKDRAWRQEMLYSFAKSYFLTSKYQQRSGTINLNFNPYLVPGLSFTMIDDSDEEQMHLTGAIAAINISLSPAGASTAVTYTAGRTLKETYEQVFIENTFGPEGGLVDLDTTTDVFDIYTTAPIMPVKIVADTLQTDEKAATYYKKLLYANDKVDNKIQRSMVFRHDNYFESTKGSALKAMLAQKKVDIGDKLSGMLTGKSDKTFPGTITNIVPDSTKKYFGTVELDLQVKDSQLASVHSYEDSMRRAARPICSIDEYMQMFNTQTNYNSLKNGVTDDEFGTPYPLTIRTYHVDEDLDAGYIRPYSRDPETLGTNAPELRRNWPARLRKYRNRIKNNHIVKR